MKRFFYLLLLCGWFSLLPRYCLAEFVEPSFAEDRSPALPAQVKTLKWSECSVMKGKDGEPDLGFFSASFQCPKANILMGQGATLADPKLASVQRHAKSLQLIFEGQKPLRLSFNEQWLAPFLDTVHSTDLNGDGKADFVLEFSFHGNGLAAVRTQVVFLVSDLKGYRFSHFKGLTSPALAQFGAVQPTAVLPPSALSSAVSVFSAGRFAADVGAKPKTSDGKPHVFFVFDLLGFAAGESLPSLIKYDGFPRWVLYQENPGAKETTLITSSEKSKLWSSPLKGLRSGYLVP
jgi:hypothetical protein